MAKRRLLPTQAYLQECFIYDPDLGTLIWKHRPLSHFVSERAYKIWNTRFAGTEAGGLSATCDGNYTRNIVTITARHCLASRIIYKLVYDEEPDNIDHEDTNPLNNALYNLRPCAHVQNQANKPISGKNTSGYKGVCLVAGKPTKPYVANIDVNGIRLYLGYYDTAEAAYAAYCDAAVKYHGAFARLK
jgi:hypothetical protein